MPFTEDLSQFFDTADFADEATITVNALPVKINVIFNNPTEDVVMLDSNVTAPAPFLMCRESDLTGLRVNQAVSVRSQSFKIAALNKDGTGTATIELKTA